MVRWPLWNLFWSTF